MRDLENPVAGRQEPSVSEDRDHPPSRRVAIQVEVVKRHTATDDGAAVIGGKAEHDPSRRTALLLAQLPVGALGQARDRATQPSGRSIRAEAKGAVRPAGARARAASSEAAAAHPARLPYHPRVAPTNSRSTPRPACAAGISIALAISSRSIGPTRM